MRYEYETLEIGQPVFILGNFKVIKGFISFARFETIQRLGDYGKDVVTSIQQKYSIKTHNGDVFMDVERDEIFTSRESLIEYVERATE